MRRLLGKIGIYWQFDCNVPFMWLGPWLLTWDRGGKLPNVCFRPGE